jgi:NADPH:quinone reductase
VRALLSVQAGGPETLVLQHVDLPATVPAGHVRVSIKACAVNYPDVLIIEDRYQRRPARPFAPGMDISGVVESVGRGSSHHLARGDRVMAQLHTGGLAEVADVPLSRCITIPATLPFEEAAAMLTTFGTARYALQDCGNIKGGETVLVLGAGGGVGLAAVELAHALGARVIGAASSAEKLSMATAKGADTGVLYASGTLDKASSRAFAEQVRAACEGRGPDVILDVVGGDYAEAALRTIARHGRYLIVGFAAGVPRVPLNLALLKSASLIGVGWSADLEQKPEWLREQLAMLVRLHETGKIRPVISERFSLADGGLAIARLARRQAVGKVVVSMD